MNGTVAADLLVVGGGINGVGIARDAAGRGLKVVLAEQDDLASHTSSRSSKLIHGGLRYLEQYEFRLVREALNEREVLLHAAPHLVRPLTFLVPHVPSMRPAWLMRLGLFLYDHLGRRKQLHGSSGIDLRRDSRGAALSPSLQRGFLYSDCRVDDSRLVVLTALDAAARGATILPRTRCLSATRTEGGWAAELQAASGARQQVRARALVNAAGPWVSRFLAEIGVPTTSSVRLVKGSHIVVPKVYDGDFALTLQNDDRRVVFVIPYEQQFSLIGTTDLAYEGDPAAICIDQEETSYLCGVASRFLRRAVSPADVVWSYSGVRPLYDDSTANPSAVTRDYVFDLLPKKPAEGEAPVLSVFGGKLTTYRKLAEHALSELTPYFPSMGRAWTAGAQLPGGDLPGGDPAAFARSLRAARRWLPQDVAQRWARAYGTRAEALLDSAANIADLGQEIGAGLYEREVAFLMESEWAQDAEDILWRRSKLGLRLDVDAVARLRALLGRA